MQQLIGDRPGVDSSFLRELFLQRLPQNVRMVLASTPEGTTRQRWPIKLWKSHVAAVSAPSSAGTAEMEHMRSEIQRLEKLVNKLFRTRSSSRSTPRPPRRSPTPPPADDASDNFCWYHHKYPLFLIVKRAGRTLAATSVAGHTHPGRLFHIYDRHNHTRFLVDTGAEVSVVPPTRTERSCPHSTFTLQAVPDHDVWCTLLHAEHWVTSHLPMGFHYCQCKTSYFGCRLFASLWACCRHPTSNPVGFHYTSSCEWPCL